MWLHFEVETSVVTPGLMRISAGLQAPDYSLVNATVACIDGSVDEDQPQGTSTFILWSSTQWFPGILIITHMTAFGGIFSVHMVLQHACC